MKLVDVRIKCKGNGFLSRSFDPSKHNGDSIADLVRRTLDSSKENERQTMSEIDRNDGSYVPIVIRGMAKDTVRHDRVEFDTRVGDLYDEHGLSILVGPSYSDSVSAFDDY